MCTVTFIPTGRDTFIFTSNRDEAPRRAATEIAQLELPNKTVIYPKDTESKGTWIAVSDTNQLVCILNGAFQRHERNPPYRLSRGLMALAFFEFDSALHFFGDFEFQEIEPFTMVIYDQCSLYVLRWDESDKHIHKLDTNKHHIWSSSTLYPPVWQNKRETWFNKWLSETDQKNRAAVLDFHKSAGVGNPEYDLVMNRRNQVRTVSISSVMKREEKVELQFNDLIEGKRIEKELSFI